MYWLAVVYSIVAVLILCGLSWLLWIDRRWNTARETAGLAALYLLTALAWPVGLVLVVMAAACGALASGFGGKHGR
jgi:hypothetical protein